MRSFGEEVSQLEAIENSPEVAVLRSLLEEIDQREPLDPIRAIEASLAQALADERYEDAAKIRDQLRLLRGGK
jgi:protein-arginine kinase activator protein McsA